MVSYRAWYPQMVLEPIPILYGVVTYTGNWYSIEARIVRIPYPETD